MGDPDQLRPQKTPEQLTEEAAREFATLAVQLRDQGHDPQAVAHFLDKVLFCLFAKDAGLLPRGLIGRLGEAMKHHSDAFAAQLGELFGRMSAQGGGYFGVERIKWFNGSLSTVPRSYG